MDGADLGTVAELEGGGDQADDQSGRQLVDVVQFGAVDVADEKAEIQRCCQNDDLSIKFKKNLLEKLKRK